MRLTTLVSVSQDLVGVRLGLTLPGLGLDLGLTAVFLIVSLTSLLNSFT